MTPDGTPTERFCIDGFDFGIEPGSEVIELYNGRLYVEVAGLANSVAQLDEDHQWSWIMYPPTLRLGGLEFDTSPEGVVTTSQDRGGTEVSLYAIAHRKLDPFELHVAGGWVTATGLVHGLNDERLPYTFDVSFQGSLEPS